MVNRLVAIAAISAALAAAPLGLTSPGGISQAFAKNDGAGGNGGGNAGGRDGASPGNSGNAPGHSNSGPGNSANAPGHATGKPDVTRGQVRSNDRPTAPQSASIRNGDRARADARGKAANELGNLNAAHASANARANASPNSMVGRIATYETQMHNALAIQDPVARNAAITNAREQLAQSANKSLTPSAVARVDGLLGIQGAPPELGAVR
jgi:hypothetical protein